MRMWRRSDNILHRLSEREISAAPPNTHIQRARLLYENIVPNYTVYDVECPDYHFRKFSNDGQFLICFSRNYQNLIVYRHNCLTFCSKGVNCENQEEFPIKGKKFESHFSQLYSLSLASGSELICTDFFLATDCNSYGIFATATTPETDPPARPGAVPNIPSMEKITFHLVRLADGTIMDERKFHDDFIHLAHNVGIFMYDDFISILSVRYQAIHILQVRKGGMFVDVRTIGPFCREDDELLLSSHAQGCSRASQGSSSRNNTIDNGLVDQHLNTIQDEVLGLGSVGNMISGLLGSNHKVAFQLGTAQDSSSPQNPSLDEVGANVKSDQMLGGLKQRLLSYIFRSFDSQDSDPNAKALRLKRFYYHFQHYADLVIWKVQFLDRYHLLIKFGSVDGVVLQNSDASNQTAFFVIYNFESTKILGFYPNNSEELLLVFEQYFDHFRVAPAYPLYMRFISSYSNNKSAREQFRKQKAACNSTKPNSFTQVIRRTLAALPCNAQSHSPSPYFDQSLFHFDERLISATDQYKPCTEHPIKFLSRRKPNALKFKINPGLEVGDSRGKRVASFIFHPTFPFAITVQQAFRQPAVVNFHMRR
ncbi:hypothetical protein GOP47_0000446 [Adiantum capillus-veneris]|uniref:DET1 homolog n=1 Tax=Adiantum capillus-veneris TaxID=13818 RepID=A0A9D4ZSW8_ADICA|nr:hypothetical protein GOP47_0000446 [Adiantum capillus-veneris]